VKQVLVILVIIAVVGVGALGWYYFKVKNQVVSLPTVTEGVAPGSTETAEGEPEGEEFAAVVPDVATLEAVEDYVGSGTASRSFDGKVFSHIVNANLPEPAPGKFYEGWLVKSQPAGDFFSTGKLEKQDEAYWLGYVVNQDYSEYNQVVVTEETEANGLDGNPETHVLEGSF